MLSKIKPVVILILFFLVLSFSTSSAFAQEDEIRITGYNGRTRYPLASSNGGPPPFPFFNYMSRIHFALKDLDNFGPNGVVPCKVVGMDNMVSYVSQGSLVNYNGDILADVFFGPAIDSVLSDEEATELAKYVMNGGVLYVSGGSFPDNTPGQGFEYNPLFEKLGIGDRFDTSLYTAEGITETQYPLESIITKGLFGDIDPLNFSTFTFRKFSRQHLGGIISPDGNEFLFHEGKVGEGYISVSGTGMFANNPFLADDDIKNYYLNLFALGCGVQDFGKYEKVVLPVPSFKQGLVPYDNSDPYWENVTYDGGSVLDLWCDSDDNGAKMFECACALTSANMVMNYFGVTKTPLGNNLDPGYLNVFAEEVLPNGGNSGFVGGNFRWDFVGNFSSYINQVYPDQPKIEQPIREDFSVERVKELIDEGKPVILKVNGGSHWVVVKGYDPDTDQLIINDPIVPDPASGYSYLDDLYTPAANDSMIIYEKTNSDFRYLQFATVSHNHLLVMDGVGNKTGYDPEAGQIVEEIPNSNYALDEYYGSPTTEGVYFLTLKLPEDGTYNLQIISQDGESHEVTVYSSDTEGKLVGGVIEPNIVGNSYEFEYVEETAGEKINVSIETQIDIVPFLNNNIVIPHKWIPVPVAILGSDTFDVNKVDRTSLTFGKSGNEASLITCSNKLVDVNKDKNKDLICYFYGHKVGLDTPDTEATLKGAYEGGVLFGATDSVKVLKPWFLF